MLLMYLMVNLYLAVIPPLGGQGVLFNSKSQIQIFSFILASHNKSQTLLIRPSLSVGEGRCRRRMGEANVLCNIPTN